MGRYLLGVDVGTTSLKVAVIDQDAKLLGISSKAYRLITPRQDYVCRYWYLIPLSGACSSR